MTIDMIIVLAVVVGAAILFATEKLPVDLTAIVVMAVLLISGIITPEEGISGFSNTATVTVAAMFILSAALNKTGAVLFVGEMASKMFKYNFWLGIVLMMISVGVLSAFINNTPVVAVFIPVVLRIAAANKFSLQNLNAIVICFNVRRGLYSHWNLNKYSCQLNSSTIQSAGIQYV
jgi:di/tricarboxylate transporter